MIKIGDFVSRKSYNHDIVFKVIDKKEKIYILKGIEFRLLADAKEEDLNVVDKNEYKPDDEHARKVLNERDLDRNDYFYLPGKILHIDADCFL